MPADYKHLMLFILLPAILVLMAPPIRTCDAGEGIETYYLKYDLKSTRNKISDDNLLMIPAKNDFRATQFSQIITTGFIHAALGEPIPLIDQRIRNHALKAILINNGLKSITTKDYDTVVSYEGVISTPLNMLQKVYQEQQGGYFYKAQVEFSPIAFPDEWERLNSVHRIKRLFHDFFQLFK